MLGDVFYLFSLLVLPIACCYNNSMAPLRNRAMCGVYVSSVWLSERVMVAFLRADRCWCCEQREILAVKRSSGSKCTVSVTVWP